MEIYITIKLTGWHAQHFMQVLRIVNLAPGPTHDESTLAQTILKAVLEDDARSHQVPRSALQ